MLKDKYEKQIFKKFSYTDNNVGKTLYLPIVFMCFTIFILNKLNGLIFFLHVVFLVAHFYFMWDEIKGSIGKDISELPMFASYDISSLQ